MTAAQIGRLDVTDFETAAEVWTALRKGEIDDPSRYGVAPRLCVPGAGSPPARRVAAWDEWGAMTGHIEGADVELADEITALLLAADAGSAGAEAALAARYAIDARLRPQAQSARIRLRVSFYTSTCRRRDD
jgi:hypothetical protein